MANITISEEVFELRLSNGKNLWGIIPRKNKVVTLKVVNKRSNSNPTMGVKTSVPFKEIYRKTRTGWKKVKHLTIMSGSYIDYFERKYFRYYDQYTTALINS